MTTEGYEGPKSLDAVIAKAARRMRGVDHSVVGFTGDPGAGKTSAALVFCDDLQQAVTGERFDPYTQIAFGEANAVFLSEILAQQGDRKVILCDEGGEGGNKLQFMSAGNIGVTEHMDKTRKKHQGYVFVRPDYNDWPERFTRNFDYHFEVRKEGGKRGVVKAEECITMRGKRKTWVHRQERFWTEMPFCGDIRPELWNGYTKVVYDYLQSEDPAKDMLLRRQAHHYQKQLRLLSQPQG